MCKTEPKPNTDLNLHRIQSVECVLGDMSSAWDEFSKRNLYANGPSIKEITEEAKEGVYLQKSYSGYVIPGKPEFYFNCESGYIIKNGELTDFIGNVGMSGNTLEVLMKTFAVGKNWQPKFLGTCGKGGQWVPVTAGGPNLGVADVVVGGQK